MISKIAKFHLEPPPKDRMKGYKWYRSHDDEGRHTNMFMMVVNKFVMFIYDINLSKSFFFRIVLKISMRNLGLHLYKVYINDDHGLTLMFLQQGQIGGQIWSPMCLHVSHGRSVSSIRQSV